jgi:hypothetical protein
MTIKGNAKIARMMILAACSVHGAYGCLPALNACQHKVTSCCKWLSGHCDTLFPKNPANESGGDNTIVPRPPNSGNGGARVQ